MSKRRVVVGMSGASGMPVLLECLRILQAQGDIQISLIATDSAILTLQQECNLGLQEVISLVDDVFDVTDIGAGPASGSYAGDGMLIVPCSMKTLAGIHSGYSDNLLLRAADVTMKEQRPLVLGVRETPFNSIHMRNMHELSMIFGVRIMPLMMSFYHKPETIEDMVFHMAAKLVEPFGVEARGFRRWNGM